MEQYTLGDGREVTVRPVRAGDQAALRRFLERLDEETRRLRFMDPDEPRDAQLARFYTHVDHEHHAGYVCEHRGELVGDARYIANPDGRSCEFAIVVADGWRHTGIARLLMDALMDHARSRGLRTMGGLVLRDNHAMLRFVARLGFEIVPGNEAPLRIIRRL